MINGNRFIASFLFAGFGLVCAAQTPATEAPPAASGSKLLAPQGKPTVESELAAPPSAVTPAAASESSTEATQTRLSDYFSGAELVGRYTTDDGGGNTSAERYTIQSCTPADAAEMFDMQVRIRYGGNDLVAPLKVRIVMADQTPVITLDQIWIPGLGTFDARVLFRGDRYAGTWQHDNVGGHLFGRVERADPATQDETAGE